LFLFLGTPHATRQRLKSSFSDTIRTSLIGSPHSSPFSKKNAAYPFKWNELRFHSSNIFELTDPFQIKPEIREQCQKDAKILKRAEELQQQGTEFNTQAYKNNSLNENVRT
jgi:hypothetical protein